MCGEECTSALYFHLPCNEACPLFRGSNDSDRAREQAGIHNDKMQTHLSFPVVGSRKKQERGGHVWEDRFVGFLGSTLSSV